MPPVPRATSPPTRAEFAALLMEVRALRKAVFLIRVAAEPRQEDTGHELPVQARRRHLHAVAAPMESAS